MSELQPASDHPAPPLGEIILYQTEDGQTRVECRFADETLWLSQALIAELFQKDVRTINEHLRNLYEEGELDPARTIRNYRIVRREGVREVAREIDHYNLDAIVAVGFRVRSERGTQFRRWALLEAEAERDQQQAFEHAAKRLPEEPKRETARP